MIFNTINRYLTKKIASTIIFTLLGLTTFSFIIRVTEELSNVGKGLYTFADALFFSFAYAFPDINIYFPMAGLLGAMIALSQLANKNELIIVQAIGISKLKVIFNFLWFIIPLFLVNLALQQWVSPVITSFAQEQKVTKISDGGIYSKKQSLWAKTPNEFIFASLKNSTINNLLVIKYDLYNANKLKEVIIGNQAIWNQNNKQWIIKEANLYSFNSSQAIEESKEKVLSSKLKELKTEFKDQVTFFNNAFQDLVQSNKIGITIYKNYQWQTALTPDKLKLVNQDTDNLSLTALWHYIKFLDSTSQNSSQYSYIFWSKIFSFVSFFTMLFVATSSIFGSVRNVSMLLKIFIAVILGLIFHVLNSTLGPFLVRVGTPPYIAALLPSFIFFIFGIYLYRKKG